MDPVSQGALGASLPQSTSDGKTVATAGLLGFLAGMAPDLDILIRSDSDPLLFLEYHRQFTHSLFFVPIGGFICALALYLLLAKKRQLDFKRTYIYCTLGYATHGLLDACTSYGTQLLWPLSNQRFSWDTISIVDPLLTLPLLVLVVIAARQKKPRYAQIGLCWVLMYQGLGFYQNHRVTEIGRQLAQERGHQPVRLTAKPSFGNIVLWKVIYQTDSGYYTDGVRAGVDIVVYPGQFVNKLDIARDLPWLDPQSQQARDIERFRWFSQDYLTVDPGNPLRITDARYSLLPNQAKGMWSIWLSPNASADEHVSFRTDRDTSAATQAAFYRMLFDELPISN